MEKLATREEVVIARKLLLMVEDAYSLCKGMGLDYEAVFKDRARERYHYWVDKMVAVLNNLIVLSPTEVQQAVDRAGSRVTRQFLSDLSIALSKGREAVEFFREQRRVLDRQILELRLEALEEAVFGGVESSE